MVDTVEPTNPDEETDPNTKLLEDIVTALGGLSVQNQELIKATRDLEGEVGNAGTGRSGRKSLLANMKATQWVGKAVKLGSDQVTQAIKTTNKLQQSAQGQGMQLKNYTQMLDQTTTSMTSNLGSYTDRIAAMGEQFDSGLRKNVESTRQLAVYTNLTGGNTKKMMKDMRKLTMGLDLSVGQEATLSNHIIGLSQTFNISSEELMNSMKGLENSMASMKAMGIAPEIEAAVASLNATLGPGMGAMASDFANELMGVNGDAIAAQLGITAEREALLLGEGNATENLMNAMEKAGSHIQNYADDMSASQHGNAFRLGIETYTKMLGKGTMGYSADG